MDGVWLPMNASATMVGLALTVLNVQLCPDANMENVDLIPTLANVMTNGKDIYAMNQFASKCLFESCEQEQILSE